MAQLAPITHYGVTDHARYEMVRRHDDADIARVLSDPEQAELIRTGRAVYQPRWDIGDPPSMYLLRVFVDIDREPPEVVTVYRTSQLEKYWRTEP